MWKQIKAHPRIILFILLFIALAVLVFIGGYKYSWAWTGFTGEKEAYKTLYDWLQLLIIPLVLAVGALLFNFATTRTEQKIAAQRYEQDQSIALDKQREDLLQAYLDRMSELLLDKQLRTSETDSEVRNVARVRTITILHQLDARRVGYIFSFLRESGLMSAKQKSSIVSLSGADLKNINFSSADLRGALLIRADLSDVNLSGANLIHANLNNANLSRVNLRTSELSNANLSNANLSYANLIRANLIRANLSNANLSYAGIYKADLTGAVLSDAVLYNARVTESNLSNAILNGTNLIKANLDGVRLINADLSSGDEIGLTDAREAILHGTNLNHVDLTNANVTEEQLKQAKSLKGATMPDGSIHT